MRTLKSILVLGLALSTFTAAEAAKLTFKVTNPNEKVKVILTFSQSGEQKEVAYNKGVALDALVASEQNREYEESKTKQLNRSA